MVRKKSVVMVLVALFVSIQMQAKGGIEFQDLTLAEGLAKAKKENKKVFVDVYATWCGPCKYLSANIFTDEDLGSFMNEHFIALKLDGEKSDGAVLMEKFDINAYPTMVFLSPEQDLLKKVVGVASAPEIKKAGNGVVFPETTKIFKFQQRYDNGNRTKAFLKEYISEVLAEEQGSEKLVAEYLTLFPELDLKDEQEFTIFCLGITDLENAYMKDFLSNIESYNRLHTDMAGAKMEMMIIGLLEDAVEKKDTSILTKGVEKLHGPYLIVYGEEAFDKAQLNEVLLEIYQKQVE